MIRRNAWGVVELELHRDARGRVTSVDVGGTEVARYRYDPLGYRIEVDGAQGVRRSRLAAEHLEALTDGQGNPVAKFLRGSVIDEVVNADYYDASGKVTNLTYHNDALQSVMGLSGHAGTVEEALRYGPFGELLSPPGATPNRLLFTGREFDQETGLYYYRARYYDPEIGRFLSEDPLGFGAGDVNKYAYVGNNPLRFNDPSGEEIYGISVGGGGGRLIKIPYLPPIPLGGGISVTAAVDSNWDWNVVVTPEIGLSTPGIAGFVRGVYAPNDEAVVTDLEGLGLSFSGQYGPVSGSVTFPMEGASPQFDNPIFEGGVGFPFTAGASGTIGYGIRLGGSDASLNDPANVGTGGTHCQCSQDPSFGFDTSSTSFDFGAGEGFVAYPSQPNLNQIQPIYAK